MVSHIEHFWLRKALVVLVFALLASRGLALTPEDILTQQIENRDSVAALYARVRWVEKRTDEGFNTEQIIKHDEFSRHYLTELCPDPSVDENDFRLDALLRNPGNGFYYGHIYDGYSTLQLSYRAEGRDLAILDGPVESQLLKKTRTPQSLTTNIAIAALSKPADSTPLLETDGDLTKVVIETEQADLKITFDASKGLMPIRIDSVQNGVSTQITADYRKFDNVWFPVVGERVINENGEIRSASFSVERIKINQPLDDKEFELRLQDGVKVLDTRLGCTWTYAHWNKPELGAPRPFMPLSTSAPSHWLSGISWLVGGVVFVASILFVRGKSGPRQRQLINPLNTQP